ncbi:MAG: 1-(5-phosphoribosyl)-5-[(5-phosphoribosylamino)methylideneamino]imidazole-4-carboxamide isomerase [Planctomycetia bacterium]|nr:1-(5-phosphoribosyl)-5-[(5-phosphoribosylamino)methylideneamino]imidazole-4-carboxamide isomerase [Planctomycetia bacterium]
MEIWPAIDIRGGQCVRLRQGDYGRETVYAASPADMAGYWVRLGARRLHLVDLDGAKQGYPANFSSLSAIVEAVGNVPCEVGGGIRTQETLESLLELGVSRLVIGTLALKSPDWFREMCLLYPYRLVLGIDARDGMVATGGWLETSSTPAIDLARQFEELPLAALVYTDIAMDGMMKGPNVRQMAEMQEAVRLPVVASGGVSRLEDVKNLNDAGITACIIGRALYEETINLQDAMKFEE